MTDHNLVSIDLAKSVFQVCRFSNDLKILSNKKFSRNKLIQEIAQLTPSNIVMEACYSAHYWGRTFEQYGHTVKLIPAQHVKPFVRGNKTMPTMLSPSGKRHYDRASNSSRLKRLSNRTFNRCIKSESGMSVIKHELAIKPVDCLANTD